MSGTLVEMHAQRNLSKWAHGPFCLAASMPAAAIPNTAELPVFTKGPKMDLSAFNEEGRARQTSARVAFALLAAFPNQLSVSLWPCARQPPLRR